MRNRVNLAVISGLCLALILALSDSILCSVFVTGDGSSHHVQTINVDGLEYVSVNDLSSILRARIHSHRLLRKVTVEFDDRQIAFTWFSPYMLYDSEMYNLGYDTKLIDGTLWVPLKGFQRIWNLLHRPPDYQAIGIVDQCEVEILDVTIQEKVNGILVEILVSGPLEYEVFSDRNRDLNINFYRGRMDTLFFSKKKTPRFVKWIKTYQFENSAQLSLRLKKPFVNVTHTLRSDPDRIQVSLIQTATYPDTARLSSGRRPREDRSPLDDRVDVIVIDPGHGGPDSGAVGPRGLAEKRVTLDVARRLGELLKQEEGLEVILTRDSDLLVLLEERTQMANSAGADLFISIHTNASRKKSVRGCETFFLSSAETDEARAVAALENSSIRFEHPDGMSQNMDDLDFILMDLVQSEYLKESQDLAAMIQGRLKSLLSIPSRGVGQAGFVVLNKAYMPAVLVEIAFISNRREESLLKKESFRQDVAYALYESIKEFKRKYESIK